MQGDTSSNTLAFDPEIERTLTKIRKEAREREAVGSEQPGSSETVEPECTANSTNLGNMEEARVTLGHYANEDNEQHSSSIVCPAVAANNFEIKPSLLSMVRQNQFAGHEQEDPNVHILMFMELCSTIKINGASDDAIRLRLFPFSLRDDAKSWLYSLPRGSITTWEDLKTKFLAQYFPTSRFIKTRSDILSFMQKDGESLYETWGRFRNLLRKCPNHGFSMLVQMQTFCNGLRPLTKMMLDASAGGSMNTRTPAEALSLIENMVANDFMIHHDRGASAKRGVLELGSQDAILAQNKLMTQQLENLTKEISKLRSEPQQAHAVQGTVHATSNAGLLQQPVLKCDFCGINHEPGPCQSSSHWTEEVNYMGNNFNRPGNQGYGYTNRPTEGWNQQANSYQRPMFQSPHPAAQVPSSSAQDNRMKNLEDTFSKFMEVSTSNQKSTQASILNLELSQKNTNAALSNLEIQMGQLAKHLTEQKQTPFSSNTETNPKEHCLSITTRSGETYGYSEKVKPSDTKLTLSEVEPDVQHSFDVQKAPDASMSETVTTEETLDVEKEGKGKRQIEKLVDDDSILRKTKKQLLMDYGKPQILPSYVKLPYPPANKKKENEKQFAKFMDIFKRLQINIPFAEALEQMPTYAKFMKELLFKKRKLVDEETVALTEECSAIIQRKLPPKLKDPGSFTIPCVIGGIDIGKALCDLGASINLMPLSMWRKLGGEAVKPTRMSLQLADRSIKFPYGILEDVLVKVDKFIFPADFVILDMNEDTEIPLILGRPFLATGRALIDVEEGQLQLRVQQEQVTFKVFEPMKHPHNRENCFNVDAIDEGTKMKLTNFTSTHFEQACNNVREGVDDQGKKNVKAQKNVLDVNKEVSNDDTTSSDTTSNQLAQRTEVNNSIRSAQGTLKRKMEAKVKPVKHAQWRRKEKTRAYLNKHFESRFFDPGQHST